MLQNQGQDLLQTLRAYQSQFSLGMFSPVGRNFKMRTCWKMMNAWMERLGREMESQTKILIIGNRTVGEKFSQLHSKYFKN